MKKIFFLLIFTFFIGKISAQGISVEISLEVNRIDSLSQKKFGLLYNCFLNITYRNITDRPLYFLKISKSHYGYPYQCGLEKRDESDSIKFNLRDYTGERFKVMIQGASYYDMSWQVFLETTDEKKAQEIHCINDELYNLHKTIHVVKRESIDQANTVAVIDYDASDITVKGISTKLRDNFVFLKSGEKYVDRYNLLGFQILGGDFSFQVFNDCFNDYVYTNPQWDKSKERWIFLKTFLPDIIGDYSLYSGLFLTNKVDIDFKKRVCF